MKILLSHNMSGEPEEKIYSIRREYAEKLSKKFSNVEIIDNYNHHMSPDSLEDIKDYSKSVDNFLLQVIDYNKSKYSFLPAEFESRNSLRLWHLGRSIQQLGQADAVYFIPGFSSSSGCEVERLLCKLYNIKVIQLEDDEENITDKSLDYTNNIVKELQIPSFLLNYTDKNNK